MRINNNIAALNVNRNAQKNGKRISSSMTKLSSGLKINSFADDVAGGSISAKMRAQIRSMQQAGRNVDDAISLIQTADGGMQKIHDNIQRQRELIVQAISGTNNPQDREKLQIEIDQLSKETNDVANQTKFNGIPLLNVPLTHFASIAAGEIDTSILTIAPGKAAAIGYIDVQAGDDFWVNLSGTDVSGAAWPDLNLKAISSNEEFGYDSVPGKLNGSTPATDNNNLSCDVIFYTGYSGNTEQFDVTGVKPAGAGRWDIIVSNKGGAVTTKFSISSSHPITLYGDFYTVSTETVEVENKDSLLYIQAGANQGDGVYINRYDCRTHTLGIANIVVDPLEEARESLSRLNTAINTVSTYRGTAGAQQNRLAYKMNSLAVTAENLQETESRIADTDMAKEAAVMVKSSVVSQAATAMLAQANTLPQACSFWAADSAGYF